MNKQEWLNEFRQKSSVILDSVDFNDEKRASKVINNYLNKMKKEAIKNVEQEYKGIKGNEDLLNEILLITYASNIVMLECRNKVWKYDYMTFSRRIGELWELFCKLTFEYSIKPLKIIKAPKYEDIKNYIKKSAHDFIDELDLNIKLKNELIEYYNVPWTFLDSGGIKLSLDLHFTQDNVNYNCDFKSGFSSNEKGNTNRLLLVASIYSNIGDYEKTILFVRQEEEINNHYLVTLKNSQKWDVYCAEDCYQTMKKFTDFDLREWLNINADWQNDIDDEFKNHLIENDLIKYLTW